MLSRASLIVPLMALLACIPALATTYHVPDQYPTIQSGIDAASAGDSVLVACGTYYEHDIVMKSGISLLSETGNADCVTIDAQEESRVLYCENVSEITLVKGFTLTGGLLVGPDGNLRGGGVYCGDHSSPTFESCTIRDNGVMNYVPERGGGMFCTTYSSPTLTGVLFKDNWTSDRNGHGLGGGLCCEESSSPRLLDCTFSGNGAGYGGGMFCDSGFPVLEHVIFDSNRSFREGGAVVYQDATATLVDVVFSANSSAMDVEYEAGGVLVLRGSTTDAPQVWRTAPFTGTIGPSCARTAHRPL